MLQLLELKGTLKWIAIITAALSTGAYYYLQKFAFPDWSLVKIVTLAPLVASLLVGVALSDPVFKRIWRMLRWWSKSFYPDLTGCWEGRIIPSSGDGMEVRATVRHSPLGIQIDFFGKTFKSITLTAAPTIEQGQQYLYYVYRSVPYDIAHPSYNGTAILRVRARAELDNHILLLSGQYHTTRGTIGTIELQQVSTDADKDVSFY